MTAEKSRNAVVFDLVMGFIVLALVVWGSCAIAVHSCSKKLDYARSSADTAYILKDEGCTAWVWFGKKS